MRYRTVGPVAYASGCGEKNDRMSAVPCLDLVRLSLRAFVTAGLMMRIHERTSLGVICCNRVSHGVWKISLS